MTLPVLPVLVAGAALPRHKPATGPQWSALYPSSFCYVPPNRHRDLVPRFVQSPDVVLRCRYIWICPSTGPRLFRFRRRFCCTTTEIASPLQATYHRASTGELFGLQERNEYSAGGTPAESIAVCISSTSSKTLRKYAVLLSSSQVT